jgi:hypothetical protein
MKLLSLSVSLGWNLLLAAQAPTQYRISGPYTHENLSIFLAQMEKGSRSAERHSLTLKDALDNRKVVVNETKKVNELTVENVSGEDILSKAGISSRAANKIG